MTDDGGGDWEVLSEVSEVETIKSYKASCMIQKLCVSYFEIKRFLLKNLTILIFIALDITRLWQHCNI